ncbi:SCO4226 family nickel-binding protein [Arthrobacter sp. ISL-30]|uniref:SCO4226 family nickel-binding protein n=1 Tax=Arthrobacter sp. ISL-30 TaxID=2819109 RepID=UPI001BE54B0D|nr:SCO4226 family nickel-binding protein [Arthrobacter sp. ISL-30]MBT2512504.1 SCO4226 family nickel-binding protein [Arthrobacter sp. ISL-30]
MALTGCLARDLMDSETHPDSLTHDWGGRTISASTGRYPIGGAIMATFMDVHHHMKGITAEDLRAAHKADLDIQDDEKVDFKNAWADPESGLVYCLSEAPSADAVLRIHERAGHPADEIHPVPLIV